MTKEEKEQFNNIYTFIKDEIFGGYDDRPLPKDLVLRIKGLREGKHYANKKVKSNGQYDYYVILMTFKAFKYEILTGLKRNESKFKDERHKINYIMAIIDNGIGTIYNKIKNIKNAEDNINRVDINTEAETAEYQRKTEEIKSERLKNMW